MQETLFNHSLNEVCALQWQACVKEAEMAFAIIPKDKVHAVKYEEFVKAPRQSLETILDFINYQANEESLEKAVSEVSDGSIGKGRSQLSNNEISILELLVCEPLKKYGYL